MALTKETKESIIKNTQEEKTIQDHRIQIAI